MRFKDTVEKGLKEIKKLLLTNNSKLDSIMADLSKLTSEVAEIKTISQSAITLIKGIAKRLEDAKGDQAKIDALVSDLNSEGDALAAAVAANTPAEEPTPTPEPGTPA